MMTDRNSVDERPSLQMDTDHEGDWWEDFFKTDRVDALGWAMAFLWGAIVIIMDNTTDLPQDYAWWDPWGVFFIGAGVITLVGSIVRLVMAEYRTSWAWSLVWGTGLLCIGLGTVSSPAWFALLLVAIAVVILVSTFTGQD